MFCCFELFGLFAALILSLLAVCLELFVLLGCFGFDYVVACVVFCCIADICMLFCFFVVICVFFVVLLGGTVPQKKWDYPHLTLRFPQDQGLRR